MNNSPAPTVSPLVSAAPIFSLCVPAMVRMSVSAATAEEAQEIVRAMLGGGEWKAAGLSDAPVRFALQCEQERKAK